MGGRMGVRVSGGGGVWRERNDAPFKQTHLGRIGKCTQLLLGATAVTARGNGGTERMPFVRIRAAPR